MSEKTPDELRDEEIQRMWDAKTKVKRELSARLGGTCDECHWWLQNLDATSAGDGYCRRLPPQLSWGCSNAYYTKICEDDGDPVDATPEWVYERGWWPRTYEDDTCGEYRRR